MDLLAGLGADHSMSAFAPANPKTDGLKSASFSVNGAAAGACDDKGAFGWKAGIHMLQSWIVILHESAASLAFYGDDLDPAEMTDRLGGGRCPNHAVRSPGCPDVSGLVLIAQWCAGQTLPDGIGRCVLTKYGGLERDRLICQF